MTLEEAIYKIMHAVYGEEVRDALADGLRAAADMAEADKLDAEAWAVGKRNGHDVPIGDSTYHNNSKYYAGFSTHPPIISEDSEWMLWNGTEYSDSGFTAMGLRGPQGVEGPQGPQGGTGVAVPVDGQYGFSVNTSGHLILTYTGDTAPDYEINSQGHLILTT